MSDSSTLFKRLPLKCVLVLSAVLMMGPFLRGQVSLRLPDISTFRQDTAFDLRQYAQVWIPDTSDVARPTYPWETPLATFRSPTQWRALFDGQERPQRMWISLRIDPSALTRNQEWLLGWNTSRYPMSSPPDSGWQHGVSGIFVPASERSFGLAYGAIPFVPLEVSPGEPFTLYFRVWPGQVRVHERLEWGHAKLLTPVHYLNYDRPVRFIDSLIMGIILAISLYNFVIFLHQTDRKIYLLLSVFSLAMMLFLMNLKDYTLGAFWPEWPRWNYTGFTMTVGLAVFSLFVRFTQQFLDTHKFVPLRHRTLNWLVLINVLYVAARLVLEEVNPEWHARNHPLMASFMRGLWILIVVAASWAAMGCRRHRPRNVRRYLLINSVLMLMALLRILYTNDVLNIPIPFDLVSFVIAVQQISFALALADHIREMDRGKEAAEAEKELERAHAEELAKLDEVKTRLYVNLTHELRTPLTIITGLAEDLQHHHLRPQEKLKVIESNGHQLLDLVNQMLDLSKLEDRKIELAPVQADLMPYLNYLADSFRALADERSLQLTFVADPESLVMDFDPLRMRQVMSNLISNAIKFTPAHGRVAVAALSQGNDDLRIKVKDNGEGIPTQHLPHVFDRFYQAPSQVQPSGGTGIGLSLVHELVKLMGGRISVESIPGRHTCFTLSLPITRQAPLEEPAYQWHRPKEEVRSAVSQEQGGIQDPDAPQVLIVEDTADMRYYLRTCLANTYRLLEAKHGGEGLELAEQHVPDLIVTDLMMPEMDGSEMLRRLRQKTQFDHIPVVILSAKDDEVTRMEGFRDGADAYLTKPFDRQALRLRIDRLLEARQRMQARLRQGGWSDPTGAILPKDPQERFLYQLRRLIEERLSDEDFHLVQLCDQMQMSKTQLTQKLKALTGETPARYLKQCRLERARHMLRFEDGRVSEIAYRVGYGDPSYFARVYKEVFGESPSETRHGQIEA